MTPSMPKRPVPHDRVFKLVYEQPAHCADLLGVALPSELSRHLALETLESRRHEFVDAELAGRLSDLLFSAPIVKCEQQVYFLIEHQGQPDKAMPVRVLGYEVGVWTRALRAEGSNGRVPLVIAVVVHQGATGWRGPTTLRELYGAPAWFLDEHAHRFPKCPLIVIDLGTMPDERLLALKMGALSKLTLWLLKHVPTDGDLMASLPAVADLYDDAIRAHAGSDLLDGLIAYTLYGKKVTRDTLRAFLQSFIGPKSSEVLMTAAEELMEEGWKDGWKEGQKEGQQRILLRLLEERFGALPETVRARVRSAETDALEHWCLRVLSAATLEDVFARAA